MQGLYLEEFDVGRKFEHALRRTVTEMDNTLFTCLTHNPQPLHIDHEFARQSEWGKPLVNSIFTLGLMIGVSVNDTTIGTTATRSTSRRRCSCGARAGRAATSASSSFCTRPSTNAASWWPNASARR